jgi:hypothetical protein
MSTFHTDLGPCKRQIANRVGSVDRKNFPEWLSPGVQLLHSLTYRLGWSIVVREPLVMTVSVNTFWNARKR